MMHPMNEIPSSTLLYVQYSNWLFSYAHDGMGTTSEIRKVNNNKHFIIDCSLTRPGLVPFGCVNWKYRVTQLQSALTASVFKLNTLIESHRMEWKKKIQRWRK